MLRAALAAARRLSTMSHSTPILPCSLSGVRFSPTAPHVTVTSPELQSALDVAAGHIRAGRTVAFPTETVYGLGASSLDPKAVAKIYSIKGRPSDNPLIIHISSMDMLESFVPQSYFPSPLYAALMEAFWPGPLTLLFPVNEPRPPPLPQTNAIRMPAHPLALALIMTAGLPISAPSANSSGRPSPTRASHVAADLGGSPDLGCILDGGECGVGVESTVVDGLSWRAGGGGSVDVLRPGGLSVEDIARVVQAVDEKYGGETMLLVHGKPWKPTAGSATPKQVTKVKTDTAPSTPGMKYRHYSPRIPVHLLLPSTIFPKPAVTGQTAPSEVVAALADGKRVGLLHYDNTPLSQALSAIHGIDITRVSLGPDASSGAQRLFGGMLELEEKGVSAILIEGCSDDGLGLAVMERVGKAVGGGGRSGELANGQISTPSNEGKFWVEV